MLWRQVIPNSKAKTVVGAGLRDMARPVKQTQPQASSIDELSASPWIGMHYRHEFLLHHRHELLECKQEFKM